MIWPNDFALWILTILDPSSVEAKGVITLISIFFYYGMILSPFLCIVGWTIKRKEKAND